MRNRPIPAFSGTLAILLVILLIVLLLIGCQKDPDPVAFPGLTGPITTTAIPTTPAPTNYDAFGAGGVHSLAILVRDQESSWLGVALGLKSIGVPFRLVTDVEEALSHRVVMVYPSLTGANTDAALMQRLTEHVETGGTLIGINVVGGGMRSLFGYEASAEHAARRQLIMQPVGLAQRLTDGHPDFTVQLGDPRVPASGLPGTHYTGLARPAVALFDDGTAAITHQIHDTPQVSGHAYAIGLDIGHFIQRAYNGRFPNLSQTYVNAYQPKVDNILRLLAMIYQQGEPAAVLLSPTPHGREFTALITHDVDYTESMANVPAYVELARQFDVPATFFIQTKYVTDFNDAAFFDESRVDVLALIRDAGMEIASHTVSHSNELQRMPTGTGTEQYPEYQPFVHDFATVRDATVMGELRVSKFLLEALTDTEVVSFRPGHLSLPAALPQLLAATGYRYSSSITANEALTHLPYRLMHDRSYDAQVAAFEFPLTIEDEEGRLGDRLDEAVALSNRIAQYNGLVTILIHTDTLGHKIEFQRQYLEIFRDRAWFDTLRGYGDWWAMRDSVVTDVVQESANRYRLIVQADGTLGGLTLKVPTSWQYLEGLDGTHQTDTGVVLGEFTGRAELVFQALPQEFRKND